VHPSSDTPDAVYGNCAKGAQSSTKLTDIHTAVEKLREETRAPGRLESMLRLAVALVLLVALVGASADLARGRKPVLFA